MADASTARLSTALVGRYEIVRELGAGGMATVYLARDVRHEREVAIKVLHPDLGAALGGERFLAEIKTTAKLQHPHILPLLDSGSAEGLLYYVMPYVEGETLRARLEREQLLPITDAIRLAREVASALDYAHRQGVIHRDIKPENILLHDGSALVADFGIALAVQQAGGQRMTQTGLSLGTPQYMAPEQAMGERTIDARADIYALGAAVYELLTGDPPFTGSTVQAIVAKVLTERPVAPTAVRDTVPAHVEAAVLQALAKVPADRPASAREFADMLAGTVPAGTLRTGTRTDGAPLLREHPRPSPARRLVQAAPWGIAASAVAVATWLALRPAPRSDGDANAPVVRMALPLGTAERVPPSQQGALAITPDGSRIAYVVQDTMGTRVMLRRTADLTPRVFIDRDVRDLLFSRDGRQLYYRDGLELRRQPLDGGDAQRVATLANDRSYLGLSWGNGDTLLLASTRGLFAVAVESGAERPITPQTGLTTRAPVLLPDARTVVLNHSDSLLGNRGTLSMVPLAGGALTPLPYRGVMPVGVLEGRLLALDLATRTLVALPADAELLRKAAPGVAVADSVIGDVNDGARATVSASGALLLLRGAELSQVILRAANGGETTLRLPRSAYERPRLSPDASRVLLSALDQLVIYDRASHALTQLGQGSRAEWSADGQSVVYTWPRAGVLQRAADGSGEPETLAAALPGAEFHLTPNGEWIVYRTPSARRDPQDIYAVRRDRLGEPRPLATGPTNEQQGSVSADGRWLAYHSNASGRYEVYLRPFPGDGPRTNVSSDGGIAPFWSTRGRTLFYRSGTRLLAADIGADGRVAPTRREIANLAALGATIGSTTTRDYDVSADEREFLFTRQQPGAERLIFVHNWIHELRERLGERTP